MSDTSMSNTQRTQNEAELSARINELRGDRRVYLGFAIGGVALLGAGVAGAYSLISGDYVPVVGNIIPGVGALTGGAALAAPGAVGAIKTSREIHKLTQS